MFKTDILNALSQLPESLQQEVLHYAEFLEQKYTHETLESSAEIHTTSQKR